MKSGSIKAIKSLAMLIYRVTNIWDWEILTFLHYYYYILDSYIIIILIFASIFVLALDMSILGHSFIKSYIFLIDTNIFPILYKFCKIIAILIVYVLYE